MSLSFTTSWIWQYNNGTQAVSLDLENRKLLWYDNPDCGCGDNAQEQTFENFLQKGARWGNPPDDVLKEMRSVVEALSTVG